jgi:tRNA-splicing ligase RtcB
MVKQIADAVWELEKEGEMRVPARVFATKELFEQMGKDRSFNQLRNVATLPGIINYAMVMPDCHEGYGFPIGGVAAFDLEEGVVSPGGVGYDINCGVRLLKTGMKAEDVRPKLRELVNKLFDNVPSGVGSKGRVRLSPQELEKATTEGVEWALSKGWGWEEDRKRCEEGGRIDGADPLVVSDTAKKRGAPQFGTLGAGNHFLEIQEISEIQSPEVAKAFGLEQGEVTVMIHCGSRGFGHQVCDDSLRSMIGTASKYKINLADRELCCAPINSPEAERYLKGMRCAVNYAFCNRHIMAHWVRETFDSVFGNGTGDRMEMLYDVCHNIAKFEEHEVEGKMKKVCVHRKGATRAFAAGRKEVPDIYRAIGQPVMIPGSMGTASYVMVGKEGAMKQSFGSSCHGSGRTMSRSKAVHSWTGKQVQEELLAKGIIIKATEYDLIAEEAPGAYKDVNMVVASVQAAGISDMVAKLVPIGVVKG